MSKREWSQEKS